MTPPAQFKASVLETLNGLNQRLPNGSHVIFIPLVDGRVLWENTHDQIHPSGATYPNLYEALIINDCSPCRGWMNPNATFRNITSEWAANLTAQYVEIIEQDAHKFHFDLYLAPLDFDALIQQYEAQGGKGIDLIEPSDGFHPSQTANILIAQEIWKFLENDHPDWLPKENPHNADIIQHFGDQGGY